MRDRDTENSTPDLSIDEKYPYLERWKWPDSYFGADWSDHFMVVGRHRDSDYITECNFQCFEKELQNCSGFVIERASHWLVGWVETILIHQDDEEGLIKANEMRKKLEDYPVYDEDALSEFEYEGMWECWNAYGESAFVDELKKEFPKFADKIDDAEDPDWNTLYFDNDPEHFSEGNSWHFGYPETLDEDKLCEALHMLHPADQVDNLQRAIRVYRHAIDFLYANYGDHAYTEASVNDLRLNIHLTEQEIADLKEWYFYDEN